MGVTISRRLHMQELLESLRNTFPGLAFTPGQTFCWVPESQEVLYKEAPVSDAKAVWSLLHETGHALLRHATYKTDIELVNMEVAAWERAKEVGQKLSIHIDEEHIQDCLDSYRDWLYSRSICPTCTTKCLQQNDARHYRCFNCHTIWKVTPSRFCRTYRSVAGGKFAGREFVVTEILQS